VVTLRGFALSGKMHAGKTTAARWLCGRLDPERAVGALLSFKQPLADFAAAIDVRPGTDDYRRVMQALGTALHAELPGWTARSLERRAAELPALARAEAEGIPLIVFVDDLRTREEAEWARRRGLILVRLECPLQVLRKRSPDPDTFDKRVSAWTETALDEWRGWDATVDTSGSLAATRRKLRALVSTYTGAWRWAA